MNKLVLIGAAAAATAIAVIGMGHSAADPGDYNTLNVVGEPYAKAVAILRAQGVPSSFAGAVGSDVPQAQCVVSSQKVLSGGKMALMLDCTEESQPEQPSVPATSGGTSGGTQGSGDAGRPTPGAPGVVTVVPSRVG